MNREYVNRDKELYNERKMRAEKKGGLSEVLWNFACNSYGKKDFSNVWLALSEVYGKSPARLSRLEEFWHPKLKKAVIYLVDEKFEKDMEEITKMRMKGQFSASMWRRSYRSEDFGYYASRMISELCACLYFSTYRQSVQELLYCQHDWLQGYESFLALEIKRNNPGIVSAVREAMLGENQTVLLTVKIIRAVIISGNEECIDLLLKLLQAARLQEGLRQQILENADAGSVETLTKILKVCLDEDMFRYSSAIRAFDTWTGLGFGDAKPGVVRKCAEFAYECLIDEKYRQQYLDSENNLEAYFALWSTGCYEIEKTDKMAEKLLEHEQKYRRILGWMFISHTDHSGYQMYMAMKHLKERDEELLAWVVSNLAVTGELLNTYYYRQEGFEVHPVENSDLPSDKEERCRLFGQLKEIAEFIGNKNKTFSGNPFAFSRVTLDKERVLACMISLAGYDMNPYLTDELMNFLPVMDVEKRRAIYCNFLEPGNNLRHREYLREALKDKSIHIKELAAQRLSKCPLTKEDLTVLSESLHSQSSSFRKSVLSILRQQKPEELSAVITHLLSSEQEYQIQAGIELLMELKNKNPELVKEQGAALSRLQGMELSTQTSILLEQLKAKEDEVMGAEIFTRENGFGLYSPEKTEISMLSKADSENSESKKGFWKILKRKDDGKLFSEKELKEMMPAKEEIEQIFDRMNAVFMRHADYEYETEAYDGSRRKVLFGDGFFIPAEYAAEVKEKGGCRLEMIPFYKEFIEAMGDAVQDIKKLAVICYVCARHNDGRRMDLITQDWFEKIEQKKLAVTYHNDFYEKYKGIRYWRMADIIALMPQAADAHELFETAMKIYRSMIAIVGEENLNKSYVQKKKDSGVIYFGDFDCYPINHRMIGYWRVLLKQSAKAKEDFKEWFLTEYSLEKLAGVSVGNCLDLEECFRAVEEGVTGKDILYERLLIGKTGETDIRVLTNPNRWVKGKNILKQYSWAQEFTDITVNRIVEVEEKRGELTTPLTMQARAIERFEGAEHFCKLLAALGKENFFRGYDYSSDTTKRAVLSRLLKRCYPRKEDTPERLKAYLKETDIKEKRLVEAVMYAPQWAGFAENILGWDGLKCGIWFFHAHINETFSAEKETETAVYSPVTPQQFNDGAFDKDWFYQAYNRLGEKKFQVLYKSAKYITTGSNQHRRSQLYSDAVLGRLKAEELEKEITQKRNQEKLRCYPLIPIQEGNMQEALRRYEFIRNFQKESRQFGALRRESERKACATAMENLAITTGFMDVNRMTWYLESEKIKEIAPLMKPKELMEVMVWLEINEDGDAELIIEKNGKRQKTLPKTLSKNETVLDLKNVIKELKEQKRRAKESLEKAMTDAVEFSTEELRKIIGNPVLSKTVLTLVWTSNGKNGFLRKEGESLCLCDIWGKEAVLSESDKVKAAHPHDFMQEGEWAAYMHFLYEHKIVQPFKQVFREYYPLTDEERQEKTVSRRYAGHQVQPQRTIALLKGRGWTIDYEEGLQKVFYKENLIVRMYAAADWFSPADIEPPTLEIIQFFDRNTGKCVDLEKIPPVLFSEVMRDIDLVVSVAHAGGVDPEASHSTVEMRTAIASELLRLLKLGNVELIGSHAKIHGSLANYSVHMGSGVVHGEGIGMLAILPVHSQSRGRIFLPFADEDPKTAEIMSKIILLAEDKKIKDPSILRQLP